MILPFWDNTISLFEGRFILLAFLLVMSWLIKFSLKIHDEGNKTSELSDSDYNIYSAPKAIIMLIIGLAVLTFGANLVVENAIKIAEILGVSQTIIGITLVAIGTSLPELAVAISSALKKQHQMIIGNIIGSNLFNTLGVLAIPGLILPFQIPVEVMSRDYIYMITLTILILILSFKLKINRFGGIILLAILASYLYQLVWI